MSPSMSVVVYIDSLSRVSVFWAWRWSLRSGVLLTHAEAALRRKPHASRTLEQGSMSGSRDRRAYCTGQVITFKFTDHSTTTQAHKVPAYDTTSNQCPRISFFRKSQQIPSSWIRSRRWETKQTAPHCRFRQL